MKKLSFTILSAASMLVTPAAFAQNCPNGSWFCAEVSVNAGVQVPPVVVQPAPPVVVQPAPPVVVQTPPVVVQTPPVVVVQSAPPPPVYVAPPPPSRVVVTTTPSYTVATETTYSWVGWNSNRQLGLGAHVAGLALPGRGEMSGRGMGGVGGSLRYRSHPWLATELTLGVFAGRDYNNATRAEVPVTLNELFYLNSADRFQVYLLAGLGVSWATVQHSGTGSAIVSSRSHDNYGYVGGQIGLGSEWQLTPHVSLYADVRAFLRTRVDQRSDTNPEFLRIVDGRQETTNTSTGATFQAGAILYF